MGISLLICLVLMICQRVPFSWTMLLAIPIFVVLYVLTFGMGMILMHFGVTLNDLSNLTNIGLKMVFYLSGVFYNIQKKLKKHPSLVVLLLKVNPIAFIMNELRVVLLEGNLPHLGLLGIWGLIGVVLCMIGVHVIHKNENSYAKVI